MIRFSIMFSVLPVLIINGAYAEAELIAVHDPNVVGNGDSPQDGFNLTRDTSSGLEWLDLTLTTAYSFNAILPELDVGGTLEGFRHATRDELVGLYASAGIPDVEFWPGTTANRLPTMHLQELLGITAPGFPQPDLFSTLGVTGELRGNGHQTATIRHNDQIGAAFLPDSRSFNSDSFESEISGHWLLRTDLIRIPGDANGDLRVDAIDLNVIGINWRSTDTSWAQGDFSGNSVTGPEDLNILALNWQVDFGRSSTAVPEPGTSFPLAVTLLTSAMLVCRGEVNCHR